MNFLNGITILLIYELVGEITTILLKLPVPGPVMGMTFLFLTLLVRKSPPESLDIASTTLLSHLSLLFVPAGVGLITHFDRIFNEWVPISLTLILSTVITLASTATIMTITNHLFSSRISNNV
ncbi:MAG: CidA/LrgA family protein [Cyanobacteria bacterium J06642_11]